MSKDLENENFKLEFVDPHVIGIFKIILDNKFRLFNELKKYCKEHNISLKQLDKLIIMANL